MQRSLRNYSKINNIGNNGLIFKFCQSTIIQPTSGVQSCHLVRLATYCSVFVWVVLLNHIFFMLTPLKENRCFDGSDPSPCLCVFLFFLFPGIFFTFWRICLNFLIRISGRKGWMVSEVRHVSHWR